MENEKGREEQSQKKSAPWRSLVALSAGIVLLIAIAVFMIWVGSLFM